MKILVLRVINSSRHRKCFVLVVCVKNPHLLVPRSFGFLTQTTRAYNPVRRTSYDVNYIPNIAQKLPSMLKYLPLCPRQLALDFWDFKINCIEFI